jgi:hypothetical protein
LVAEYARRTQVATQRLVEVDALPVGQAGPAADGGGAAHAFELAVDFARPQGARVAMLMAPLSE